MSQRLRFGVLNYVNCLPATLAIEKSLVGGGELSLEFGNPSDLNARMRRGELDVSLVSAAEYLHNEHLYLPLPGFSLWCDGPVESVCLYSPHSKQELMQNSGLIGVTPQSATSVALSQLLLPEGMTESFSTLEEAKRGLEAGRFRAILLIGDQSLEPPTWTSELKVHDLGQWWKEETGHPMTFALWVARRDLPRGRLLQAQALLESSLLWGRQNKAQVIGEGHERSGLSRPRIAAYYQKIQYQTESKSHAGFLEFRKRLQRLKAIPAKNSHGERKLVRVTAL